MTADSLDSFLAGAETALFLRTCKKDGLPPSGDARRAQPNFKWNLEIGAVNEAPDWSPEPECGHGLHGLLWGEQSAGSLIRCEDEVGVVFEARLDEHVVVESNKSKVRRCVIRFTGTLVDAASFLAAHAKSKGLDKIVHHASVSAGDGGTAKAGDGGTAQAGDGGTAKAGDGGTAKAGDRGTAQAGDRGTAKAGDGGTAQAGYRGTAQAGYRGTAQAGDGGTAKAGYRGTAQAGDGGTAQAGDGGTAQAGDGGTAQAGYRGTVILEWWDSKNRRTRMVVAYTGEDDIEAGVLYKLDPATKKAVKVPDQR